MIKKLDNKNENVAQNIRSVFQESYKVEAELLKAIDFPPLKRALKDYIRTDTDFYGYFKKEELAAVIEISKKPNYTDIRSLVVLPAFFRQGIARKLMQFTLDNFYSDLYVVETGVENEPASRLYKDFGFVEVKQWDTNQGVRKVKFERRVDN